jgi:prepilin-type N-terminal cleavage/methylation domain-containing protein/prepilin-type processing-associated H-X9-DG protein
MSVKPNKRAFTLLEMLVVLAIIGILAAILLRQITKAKEAGLATQCKANLKSLYQASLNYAVVNRGGGPYAQPSEWQDDQGIYHNREGWVTWVMGGGNPTPRSTLWTNSPTGSQAPTTLGSGLPNCYGVDAKLSIQHGTLWDYTDKNLKSYVCPKFAQKAICGRSDAMRSYAMSTNMSGSSPLQISTEACRTMLYAELQPWLRDPRWRGSPAVCGCCADNVSVRGNNGILDPVKIQEDLYGMLDDSIGFLHQMGGLYCGHVVFCDGHVEAVPLEKVGGAWINRTMDACTGKF